MTCPTFRRSVLLVWGLALGAAALAACATSPTTGVAPPPANVGQPAGVTSGQPAPAAGSPRTADECRSCNGIWAVHGLAQTESCNCRTRDGGKRCRDGADCEGMCLAAEEPEREVVQPGPPARGFFIGRCSDRMTVFGCNRIIDRGAAANGPVPLGEAPSTICVD